MASPHSATRLFLIGYRGTGKSTVGRFLAEQLGWDFADADAILEERAGRSIADIFTREGELGFRDRESAVLVDLSRRTNHVIATGGGVILRPENRDLLKASGYVAWLTAEPEIVWQRLTADPTTRGRRPNLTTTGGSEEVRALLAAREPLYAATADLSVATDRVSPEVVAAAILGRMDWLLNIPILVYGTFVFLIGLGVGSFLNVLIARLPFEKSIIWPGSRCFTCLKPIHWADNLPLVGYLRLRGRCRHCGAAFSSRYLWVELGTGLAFLGLFLLEIVRNVHRIPGIQSAEYALRTGTPPLWLIAFFAYHAALLSLLIAAAFIDAEHRIIPSSITHVGVLIGLVGAVLMPWPWPSSPAVAESLQNKLVWSFVGDWGHIPLGLQPWPFWGPLPDWAEPGSWQLGLVNGVLGALAGTFLVRAVKALFEVGLGREALGLGDADLMMMAGAFLGWQPVTVALFMGAFAALALKLPVMAWELVRGVKSERELPFGPGLALGIVITWLGWRWIGPSVQFVFFDLTILGLVVVVMGGGMLAAGLLLRRGESR